MSTFTKLMLAFVISAFLTPAAFATCEKIAIPRDVRAFPAPSSINCGAIAVTPVIKGVVKNANAAQAKSDAAIACSTSMQGLGSGGKLGTFEVDKTGTDRFYFSCTLLFPAPPPIIPILGCVPSYMAECKACLLNFPNSYDDPTVKNRGPILSDTVPVFDFLDNPTQPSTCHGMSTVIKRVSIAFCSSRPVAHVDFGAPSCECDAGSDNKHFFLDGERAIRYSCGL